MRAAGATGKGGECMKKYAVVLQIKRSGKVSLDVYMADNAEQAKQNCAEYYQGRAEILSIVEIPEVTA